MLNIELSDEQTGWINDVDATDVYKDANLPTDDDPQGESESGDGSEGA